jgi:hypothetical protein
MRALDPNIYMHMRGEIYKEGKKKKERKKGEGRHAHERGKTQKPPPP